MGSGEVFNSNLCFIVCSIVAGSPYGTILPVSTNPDTGGPYGPSFPSASIRDDMLYVSSHSIIRVGGSGLTITPTRYHLKSPQTCTGPSRHRIRRGLDRRFDGRDDRLPMASLHISWFRSPYHPTRCDLHTSLGMVYLAGRDPDTGGEGSFTQWVHYESVVSFEAIRPVITQQVCGEFSLKVPAKVPTGYFLNETPEFVSKEPTKLPSRYFFKK